MAWMFLLASPRTTDITLQDQNGPTVFEIVMMESVEDCCS